MPAELPFVQLELMREEAVVHLPESPLGPSGLGGLRGGRCPRVELGHGKVSEDEPELVAEALQQVQDLRIRVAAGRALEIAVLDQGH